MRAERFISAAGMAPEPGNLPAFNRYSYCVNNPIIYIDPNGHFPPIVWTIAYIAAHIAGCNAQGNGWNTVSAMAGGFAGGAGAGGADAMANGRLSFSER